MKLKLLLKGPGKNCALNIMSFLLFNGFVTEMQQLINRALINQSKTLVMLSDYFSVKITNNAYRNTGKNTNAFYFAFCMLLRTFGKSSVFQNFIILILLYLGILYAALALTVVPYNILKQTIG